MPTLAVALALVPGLLTHPFFHSSLFYETDIYGIASLPAGNYTLRYNQADGGSARKFFVKQ